MSTCSTAMRHGAREVFFLLLALLVVLPALAFSPAEVEEEHRQSLAYVTPHTEWARPYARGKVRMLFFSQTGRNDTLGREAVELMQRFDISADAVYGDFQHGQDPTNLWIGGTTGEQRMLRLVQQPYDVYVFQQISPRRLPRPVREKIRAALLAGAGLVLVGTDDKPTSGTSVGEAKPLDPDDNVSQMELLDSPLIRPDERIVPLPSALRGEEPGCAYTIERGRAIELPSRPMIDYHQGWEAEYDYWQLRLGQAVLWAAGREPQTALSLSITPRFPTGARRRRRPLPRHGTRLRRGHRCGCRYACAMAAVCRARSARLPVRREKRSSRCRRSRPVPHRWKPG